MSAGNGSAAANTIIPVAATLFGSWTIFRIFPRKIQRAGNTDSVPPKPEPWHRRLGGWFAGLIFCAVAIVWNLSVFHIAIQAATKGQIMLMVIQIPFSLIGGFLLLLLFVAIGLLLDFLFQIKDESENAQRVVQGAARTPASVSVPPILEQTPAPSPSPERPRGPALAPAPAPEISVKPVAASKNNSIGRTPPVLGALVLIIALNWFVFAGISIHLGGDPIGILPSQDGFILKSHGRHTAVSESTWVFSLYYSAATLLISPAIILLFAGVQFWPRRREGKWYKKLFLVAFLTVWCVGWYGSIGHAFLKSRADWLHLKEHSTTSR